MHQRGAEQNGFALFQHDPVIAGQVWFALAAVNDQVVDSLALWWGELDVGRKCRSAKSHHAHGLDARDYLLTREVLKGSWFSGQDLLCRAGIGPKGDRGHHPAVAIQ